MKANDEDVSSSQGTIRLEEAAAYQEKHKRKRETRAKQQTQPADPKDSLRAMQWAVIHEEQKKNQEREPQHVAEGSSQGS